MGLGDDLMITGFVEKEKKKHPNKQIVIGNLKEKIIYDSLIYKNNPNITPINQVNRDKPIHFITIYTNSLLSVISACITVTHIVSLCDKSFICKKNSWETSG